MKSFSISRVAHYARYHYSVTRFHYLSFIVAAIALPVLFGILGKNLIVPESMLVPIYIFGGVAMAVSTTRTMRGRGTKIIDGVLPVSALERQIFNAFNLGVVYPLLFVVIAVAALGAVVPFNESEYTTFSSAFMSLWNDAIWYWPVYVFVQIVCSTSLLINILARRSLVFAYALVFFVCFGSLVVFVTGMQWLSDNVVFIWSFNPTEAEMDAIEYTLKTIFCMIPVAIYALGYVALRKRQVKW